MPCLYCTCYAYSLRRLNTNADGRRICEVTKTWKSADDEICGEFQPVTNFWCNKLQHIVFVDACRMKKQTGRPKKCIRCSQGNEITDIIRLRARIPKPEVSNENIKNNKPALLRRKK